MSVILFVILVVSCIAILYEDVRYRRVQVQWFVLLSIAGFGFQYRATGWAATGLNTTINAGICIVQLGLLMAYLKWIRKEPRSLAQQLGAGDVVFLGALCTFFPPLSFLIGYITSLLFALLGHLLVARHQVYRQTPNTVALAGWQALFLLLLIGSAGLLSYDLFSDAYLLSFLQP